MTVTFTRSVLRKGDRHFHGQWADMEVNITAINGAVPLDPAAFWWVLW
jgi:hypothetical protein